MKKVDSIKEINISVLDESKFKYRFVSCIVHSNKGEIILQQRLENWRTFPGFLSTFGGKIETEETPMLALIRELNEELGANVKENQVKFLGAYTEEYTNHSDLIYGYYWYDKDNTITGCYECEAKYYDSIDSVLKHPKLMDDVVWLLEKCKEMNLLNDMKK